MFGRYIYQDQHFCWKMSLQQKMFRVKPYTNCINCILSHKLKCHQCMNQLITLMKNNITNNQSTSKTNPPYYQNNTNHQTQFIVSNQYQQWLHKITNRNQAYQLKSKQNKHNIIHFQDTQLGWAMPKFQSWEKKLVQKLTKNKPKACINLRMDSFSNLKKLTK